MDYQPRGRRGGRGNRNEEVGETMIVHFRGLLTTYYFYTNIYYGNHNFTIIIYYEVLFKQFLSFC